ncbi:MAG: catalase [Candidatus Dormibacteraeota bacterium]|uniref:Catalase n=1 Tax=Candidatus Amunia macphersoniae TaxID=3127014 RepID=A0A934NFT1_9BACT|nr:catalase [Candidatus Dormibacteraeota bacterium]
MTKKKATPRRATTKSLPSPEVAAVSPGWAQDGDALTTSLGVRVSDTDNSLRAGSRGPTLLEDFHLREKIMHFDHERIPERVVHARGAAAHGRFILDTPIPELTSAAFLTAQRETPVFLRFSTVAGSRGSADTARDVRGFAVKFYTAEGNFDLVGNNIPVFFIQDGIKFPDVIHAAKPQPDREIPQAQTAHDTFWDFVSLTPESTHMLMWVMSDRAIPRSFRTMEGFGIHTFRLVNEQGKSTLVKFHWKPAAGVHSLVWEESQKLGGIDPDFHRRDLWNAIESGAFPQWELGLQVMPDTEDQTFRGIDLLDPTKIVPEELAPVTRIGRMILDRNPINFFAETEQVAFCAGSFVRGIEPTDDPLLQARLFSYLDTQLTRLGGPNFNQLPINRPIAPVNDNLRDGFGQQAVPLGRAPYVPNSLDGGTPIHTKDGLVGGYTVLPRAVDGPKVRERPLSFEDHYTQAALFWQSMSAVEQKHIVDAFSFELSHVEAAEIRARMLERLGSVDADLTRRVAANLGLPAPAGSPPTDIAPSPALSMLAAASGPIDGRVIAVIATDGADAKGIAAVRAAVQAANAVLHVVAPHAGMLTTSGAGAVEATKTLFGAQSVEFDAVVVAGGTGARELSAVPAVALFLQEAYRHHKTVGAWADGRAVLAAAAIADGPGVVTGESANAIATPLITAVGWHRHWNRD